MNVLIAVTHLLGTGHLSRALTLGRAFAQAGHRVMVTFGGMPAPHLHTDGVELLQLPPLRSDGTNFTRLLNADGNPADLEHLTKRIEALIGALDTFGPDVLITELFPFGRRVLSAEFLALLEHAAAMTPRPVILSSVRDILAPPSKPAKADRAEEIVLHYYDAVLVHSDPHTTRLEQSWPVSDRMAPKLRYTGYVAPPPVRAHPDGTGKGEVLVTAGGGDVGLPLFRAAIGATHLMPEQPFRLLVGGEGARVTELRMLSGDNTIIEPARPDFRQMLAHAAGSISMCGYNTALDLLRAGTPGVLIPFDAGNEVEQGLRAESLAALPALSVLKSADLTPERLAHTLRAVMAEGPRHGGEVDFDGANHAVHIAEEIAEAR